MVHDHVQPEQPGIDVDDVLLVLLVLVLVVVVLLLVVVVVVSPEHGMPRIS